LPDHLDAAQTTRENKQYGRDDHGELGSHTAPVARA
jgi:hypothetical protein